MKLAMRLSDSRILVLDVVASVASGMPVYYPIPDMMAAEAELMKMEPGAKAGSLTPLERLRAFLQTHLTAAKRAIAPREPRRHRAF